MCRSVREQFDAELKFRRAATAAQFLFLSKQFRIGRLLNAMASQAFFLTAVIFRYVSEFVKRKMRRKVQTGNAPDAAGRVVYQTEGKHMKRRSLILFAAALLLTSVCSASRAFATSYLDLTVECVKDNGDGTFTADVGYYNGYRDDGFLIISSSGDDKNFFAPGEANRGQPTSFQYGRYPGQFKVTWDGSPLVWTVTYRILGQEYQSTVTLDPENENQRACRIVPYADCIMREYRRRANSNWYESYDTYFSYFNPGEEVTLPEGSENRVTHNPWCSGDDCESELSDKQPNVFLPGHHRGAFSADSRQILGKWFWKPGREMLDQ